MKTTIGALKSAIKKALKAVETSSCAIQAQNDKLTIVAASAQGSIMIDVPVEGPVTACSAVINAKQVGAILGGVADAVDCKIKADNGIVLSFGGSRIKLTQPFEDTVSDMFGVSLQGERIRAFETKGKDFSLLMDGPIQYAAKSDVRYYLVGVQAICDGGLLRLTGTNGTKLCTAKSGISAHAMMRPCIFPFSVAEAVRAVFDADEDFVVEQIGEQSNMRILLRSERVQWITSSIAGVYPDWRRVLPRSERVGLVVLGRDAIVSALWRVMAASDEAFAQIVFAPNGVQILSVDGQQREEFQVDLAIRKTVRIGVTGKLLAEAIEAVETPTFELALDGNDETAKFVITPVEATISDWLGICMPARI